MATKRERLRTKSKKLFGNSYMLEVMVGVAESPDRVNLTQLLVGKGVSPSSYSGPLRRLADVGLLRLAPRNDDDHRERWYEAKDSPLWDAAVELAQ